MRWRLGCVGIFAVLFALVGIFPATAPVGAAPRVVFGPPAIVKHVILNETSIDGPSLWQPNSRTGPQVGRGLVLAWTGTDSAHRLNTLEVSRTLTFSNKHIYNETSSLRPAVTTVPDGGIALAWVGTNSRHSLNVLCNGCGSAGGTQKLTLWDETSFTAPSLAYSGSKLWLAWTGTDANHSLNVLPINFQTFKPGTKAILRQFSSVARPALMPDPNIGPSGLIMAWAATSPAHRIRFATSTDGVSWTQPSSSPLAEWTAVGPSILALNVNNFPHYFLGWTGTDPAHSINVQYTESFPAWPVDNSKTTFDEWALGGPALADSLVERQIVLGWTGTDPLHRLNLALVGV
ncbi:MAG TPA: hypothetical protein VF040_19710 [Ktedonobacterales bacterium]